jgi:very-short-patch-repair endonuclease
MRQKSANDQAIAEIAARQRGVITTRQLRLAGLAPSGVSRRVRAGRLHRVHQGVYAVGHREISQEGRWMAAVLACGGGPQAGNVTTVLSYWGAVVSHRSAAVLWELLPAIDGSVDVSVPGDGGRAKRRGIRLHRSLTLLPAAVTLRGGIPVTTPARTILDLRRAVSTSARRGLSAGGLRRAIRQADVLGLPLGDESQSDHTRSDLELAFLQLCRRHRLPTPEVNVRIGRHLVDFLWRDRRLVVETDGYRYHRGRTAFEDDRARDLELPARGFEVLRIGERQLDDEPKRVAEVLAAALRVGADD